VKARSGNFALLRFWFWSAPWDLWGTWAIYSMLAVVQVIRLRDASGFGHDALAIYFPVMLIPVLGHRIFLNVSFSPPVTKPVLPYGEFLVTRPISRRRIQYFFGGVYVALVFAPILMVLAFALRSPDLRLSLHHGTHGSTEAFERQADYRAQFPRSTILPSLDGGGRDLLIPSGSLLAAGWLLGTATLVAVETLVFLQLRFPYWRKFVSYPFTILLLICSLLAQFRSTDGIPEYLFFFFCHHWPWFALSTIVLAALCLLKITQAAAQIEA
jgi:hypothetical protein